MARSASHFALVALFVHFVSHFEVAGAAPCALTVAASGGSYSVQCGAWPALKSFETALYANGAWLSTANGSLVGGSATAHSGADAWGAWSGYEVPYTAASGGALLMLGRFRAYADVPAIAFEAFFPSAVATGLTEKNREGLASAFPSFATPASPSSLGYIEWAGPFINRGLAGPVFGTFDKTGAAAYSGGTSSGPTMLFDASGVDALVISSSSNFMSASSTMSAASLSLGVLGSVAELPAGWSQESVLWFGAGPNAAMSAWGEALLGKFGKPHDGSRFDYTNQMLGYNTDHGTYFYYTTGPYTDYLQALLAVYDQSIVQKIPYKFVLLDSWWYYKGLGGGVYNWTAMPSVFPGGNAGIRSLVQQTGWKVTAHNRWWSANTNYARANGGQYDFYVDAKGSGAGGVMALPLEGRFWEALLVNASKDWGLTTYEQDWLYNELDGVDLILTNISVGRTWLLEMGLGAQAAGVTIQYCMAYPRHLLQSVEIPAVTQVRASDDHVPAGTQLQWRLGFSSMLTWAVGVAPFKDNAWSTSSEPGGSCGNALEASPGLHLAISTFSAGPVTPGDGVSYQNASQIMRTCTAGGVVLHPSRAMVALDAQVLGEVFAGVGTHGQVYSTYSLVGALVFDHILAGDLAAPFAVLPAHLLGVRADIPMRAAFGPAGARTLAERLRLRSLAEAAAEVVGGSAALAVVAYAVSTATMGINTLVVQPFDAAHPINLVACGEVDFQVWHTAPVFASGWSILGELSKWVPVAHGSRVSSIEAGDSQVTVLLVGEPAEVVPFTFWSAAKTVTLTCVLDASGRATASMPDATCA